MRAKQLTFLPLVGARTQAQVTEAVRALEHSLNPAQVTELEALLLAVQGSRYAAPHMANLDSEN